MRKQAKFKIISLFLMFLVAIGGLTLGFIGSTELLRHADQITIVSQLPLASQISGKIMWVSMTMFVAYIFIFKEKKRNLFWIILSFFGIIFFSIKKIVGELMYAKKN